MNEYSVHVGKVSAGAPGGDSLDGRSLARAIETALGGMLRHGPRATPPGAEGGDEAAVATHVARAVYDAIGTGRGDEGT
jgi:hypothetical protein